MGLGAASLAGEDAKTAAMDPLQASRKNYPSPPPLEQRLLIGVSPGDDEEGSSFVGEAMKALNNEGLRSVGLLERAECTDQ